MLSLYTYLSVLYFLLEQERTLTLQVSIVVSSSRLYRFGVIDEASTVGESIHHSSSYSISIHDHVASVYSVLLHEECYCLNRLCCAALIIRLYPEPSISFSEADPCGIFTEPCYVTYQIVFVTLWLYRSHPVDIIHLE